MTRYVFDTNIISFMLRPEPELFSRVQDMLASDAVVLACPAVWYEVRRGLLARDSKRLMSAAEALFERFVWDDYAREDWELAAVWWAQRRTQGRPIGDADLLIAVFARNRQAVLVTDDEEDFAGLGITVENWRRV